MLKRTRLTISLLAAALLAALVVPVSAQGGTSFPLAAVTDGMVVLYNFGGAPQPVTQTPAQNTLDLAWSPNGEHLAFTRWDENYRLALWLSGRDARPPVQAATGLAAGLPITFTADNQLVYAVDTGQFDTSQTEGGPGGAILNVFSLDPAGGTDPQPIGTFVFGVGCGGGSSSPADWRYWAEAGTGPGIASAVFAVTPAGLVHSTRCTGRGVALLNLETGEDVVLDDALGNAAVAPDGSRVAGVVNDGEITVIDPATHAATAFSAAQGVDRVAWAADGQSLFYSTRQETGQTLPATPEEAQQLAQALGVMEPSSLEMPVMSVGLQQLDLASGTNTALYVAEAYAVGRIIPAPDGQMVLFSQIPNLQLWVQQIISGALDVTGDVGQQQLDTVPVTLFALSLADSSVTAIGTELNQAVLNTAAYGER